MPTFSAALIAGGKSTRMGRDKALLPVPGSDEVLWQRQLHVLRELQPEEIFWSGHPRPGIPANIMVVPDAVENAGPLAGLSACLDLLGSELLVVLAVDLAAMTTSFLRDLERKCTSSRGAVILHGDFYEPLAAIYPKALHGLAAIHLREGRHALQDFIREAVKRDLLEAVPLEEKDAPLFKNLNSPKDL